MVKVNTLKKQTDFKRVFNNGKIFGNRNFILYYKKNDCVFNRLGIIVSKKISKKSVVRNKIRRRIKEAYRTNEYTFLQGYDLIIVAKNACVDESYSHMEKSLKHLFYKKNLLRQ